MHGCLGCTRHAQGGARGLGCAAVRAKGGGEKGRAHLVLNARLETRQKRRRLANSRMVPLEPSR